MINQLRIISNFKLNNDYRLSFNNLANKIFGIDFENWFSKGLWTDRFICYSYIAGKNVVANLSVNKMDVIIEGERKIAIQIGTVMTEPAYRGKGLSAALMNTVMKEYENSVDFIFLFANETVLEFYPKFGFETLEESQFILKVSYASTSTLDNVIKLQPAENSEDLKLIFDIYKDKKISTKLDVVQGEHLLSFYCLTVFSDNIYYIKDLDTVVIYTVEKNTLQLFDVIRRKDIPLKPILDYIVTEAVNKVVFHFTPDFYDITPIPVSRDNSNDTLFIKSNTTPFPKEPFTFPITAHS